MKTVNNAALTSAVIFEKVSSAAMYSLIKYSPLDGSSVFVVCYRQEQKKSVFSRFILLGIIIRLNA